MKKYTLLSALFALIALASCGGNEFKVSGTINGDADGKYAIQVSENGYWFFVDSVKTDSNGKFSFSHPAPEYPGIYRLVNSDGVSICFPVDSLENISFETSKADFGVKYTLAGSDDAVAMMEIDNKARELSKNASGKAATDVKAREDFKRELANKILENPSGILAYYVINKQIANKPLFAINNSVDVRIIGAVANAYHEQKPNDPRTKLLVAMFLNGKKLSSPAKVKSDTIQATEAKLIEIELPDIHGKMRKLSEVAAGGKVVLVNFTAYGTEESPAFNKLLADIYNKYSGQNFQIYQIALDADIASWKMSAKNIPWVAVYDEAGPYSKAILNYNVGSIPMSFIINRSGEIVKRIGDPNAIATEVAKYM